MAALAEIVIQRISATLAAPEVALSSFFVPNWPGTPQVEMRVEGRAPSEVAASLHRVINVTPGYFRTQKIELLAGREFRESDNSGTPPVAIVGNALATRFWPGEDPLGRRIHLGGPGDDWLTVIGVVPSGRASPFARDTARLLYVPIAQRALTQPANDQLTLHLRLESAAAGLPQRVREG